MWGVVHFLSGWFGAAVAIGAWALYSYGFITPRTESIVWTIWWVTAYLDDFHLHQPIWYLIFDMVMIVCGAIAIGRGGPKRPRKKLHLRSYGYKAKAAMAKLKASIPTIPIPRLAPNPA